MIILRAFVVAAALAIAWAPQAAPVLRLLEPTADTIMTGPVTFRVSIAGGRLRLVEFQVDGVEVCRAAAAPFECTWNAGNRVSARDVRAVATLDDGRRVIAAVRTKGLTVNDRSEVVSVMVSALVTDGRGKFVSGLKAEDFRVLDEGVPQKVEVIDGGEDGAEVVLALDLSASMFAVVDELKVVVRDFMDRLRPVDKITLAGFNSGFFPIAPREADRATRNKEIDALDPYGGTAIFDAMIEAAKVVSAQPGRRAIIMFSDGDDLTSRATIESARIAVHSEGATLYLVATGKADSDPTLRRALTTLCVETGGAGYFAGKLSGTVEHFREIVEELSKQYLLAFTPDPPHSDGKWRRLSVEARDRSLKVRARTGYFPSKGGGF